jgi:bacterioferritin-associated ferredoxin
MGLLSKNRECWSFRTQLEDAATAAPDAQTLAELSAAVPVLRSHLAACASCREAAEALLVTRAALSAMPSSADLGGPWFASRVMAAIAERKAELARVADTWTLLPKLAARLTWASSIALLLASAWLYHKPASVAVQTIPRAVATDITGEPLVVESATPPRTDDEVLLSLAEKDRKPR